jgi:hypothetical protein
MKQGVFPVSFSQEVSRDNLRDFIDNTLAVELSWDKVCFTSLLFSLSFAFSLSPLLLSSIRSVNESIKKRKDSFPVFHYCFRFFLRFILFLRSILFSILSSIYSSSSILSQRVSWKITVRRVFENTSFLFFLLTNSLALLLLQVVAGREFRNI